MKRLLAAIFSVTIVAFGSIAEAAIPLEVSVEQFGAKCDGKSDDSGAIQKAINAVQAGNGGIVRFFPGTCKISTPLTISGHDVVLQGAGRQSTIIEPIGSIDAIDIGVSNAITYNSQVRDLKISYTDKVSSGNGILLLHTYHAIIRNVYINNPWYGISVAPSVDVKILDTAIVGFHSNGSQIGIHFYGGRNAIPNFVNVPTQVVVERTQVFGPLNGGFLSSIWIRAAEQMSFVNCYVGNAFQYSFNIQQDKNNWPVYDLYIGDSYVDGSGISGIVISGATGNGSNNIQNVHVSNSTIKGQGGTGQVGISIDGTNRGGNYPQALNGLKLSNVTIVGWKTHGIDLRGGYGTIITGSEIKGNNYLNSGSGNGINIGAAARQITITGNRIGGDAFSANSAHAYQIHGVKIDDGAINIQISANNVTGNVTSGIQDDDAQPTKNITNNLGYNDKLRAASPPMPASSMTFTNPYGTPAYISIFEGTVTDIKLNGTTIFSKTGVQFPIQPGGTVTLTYTVSPKWIWWRL